MDAMLPKGGGDKGFSKSLVLVKFAGATSSALVFMIY